MIYAYILIILLSVVALVGTILAVVFEEKDYGKKTKGNIVRLTSIYAIVILVSFVAIGIYIYLKK